MVTSTQQKPRQISEHLHPRPPHRCFFDFFDLPIFSSNSHYKQPDYYWSLRKQTPCHAHCRSQRARFARTNQFTWERVLSRARERKGESKTDWEREREGV
eukprot:scpid90136/ scgid14642/ 